MATDNIFDSLDRDAGFKTEEKPPTIIKVVGVGGGGNNAINHMYAQNIGGVSFVVINTDRQALQNSPVPNRLLIGPETTCGLGAGNDPEMAKAAAEESADDIAALFDDDTKMVFITAGMGGGTGTGAGPVVARITRDKGILTIGIVTIPFLFEGKRKILKALQGADEMHKYVDALLIINNERLTEIYPDLNFVNAFGKADDTLSIAARSISEIITVNGRMNLDFNDVNTTLREGGVAIISSGYGEGDNRAIKAIEDALNSPLLKNRDVYSSKKILIQLYVSEESHDPFLASEFNEVKKFMNNFSDEVDVIWGWAYDNTLDDKIKITILAAGFDMSVEPDFSESGAQNLDGKTTPESLDNRLMDEYGQDKITRNELEKAEARYLVLRTEDIDNDDLIELFEKTPTFNRNPKFKQRINELRNKVPGVKPHEPGNQPPKATAGTISFGN